MSLAAPRYRDASLPVAERVADLLPRMSLAEKVGQLMQLDGQSDAAALVRDFHVGSLLHVNGSAADAAQRAALQTRLGIPLLLADDGIHGHSFWAGATIFPTQLALACSWSPELAREVARVTAVEMRATGLKWTFSPVLCLARDLRWGRVNETFGEDPLLVGSLAQAMIDGYQGQGLHDPDAVLATAKHYAGYSETLGGRDASEAELSRRKLRAVFLPPFERAARGGAMAFMTGYQAIDGVPSTANRWLLTEVLRGEWGYEGIVLTDWNNLGHLVHSQRVCADHAEAAALALRAGNDLIMATPEFFDGAQQAVARGLLAEAEIDAVLTRVLALKFRLGLFEDPGWSSAERIARDVGSAAHRAVALRAARESLVLLRNEAWQGGAPLLPLQAAQPLRIAVLGPNADDPDAQLGDWSLGSGQMSGPSGERHPRACTVTARDGIQARLPAGWTLVDDAAAADLIVAVVGDRVAYNGEFKSTATLELQDGQIDWLAGIAALGKPWVAVLLAGKPLVLPPALQQAPALLQQFNPGMLGGQALAEALFGDFSPSGRLPISIPVHVGQQPVFYNAVRGQHGDRYADLTQEPAFAFGYGLGYGQVDWGEPQLDRSEAARGDTVRLSLTLHNATPREQLELLQLYVEDEVTSATWPALELKAWQRVRLAPGERRSAHLSLAVDDLWIVDAEGRRVVEPGRFTLWLGRSSRRQDRQPLSLLIR